MRVVLAHMAYRVVETRRITPYQAQYFWHTAHQRRANGDGEPAHQAGIRRPKPIRWIVAMGFLTALTVCFVVLVLLTALLIWVT
jgi:hypothetical protein